MDQLTAITVVAITASVLISWLFLLYFVPRNMLSLFRYRLWRLRDAIRDDIHSGDLPDSKVTHLLVQVVESAIAVAPILTMLRYLIMPKPSIRVHIQTLPLFLAFSLSLAFLSLLHFLQVSAPLVIVPVHVGHGSTA